jgi:hypothetical protein
VIAGAAGNLINMRRLADALIRRCVRIFAAATVVLTEPATSVSDMSSTSRMTITA